MGFALINFGLASRIQQVPNRQDTLETNLSGLDGTIETTNSNLALVSACMAANVGWVSNYEFGIFYRSFYSKMRIKI